MAAVTIRPIDRMNNEWEALGRSPDARRAALTLARVEPEIADLKVTDLSQLVDRLRQSRDACEQDRAARVIQAMLRSSSAHPLVPRAILQAMLPGLVGV